MKRLLVTGGAGFLGQHICAKAVADKGIRRVFATYHKNRPIVEGAEYYRLDLGDADKLQKLIEDLKPDTLIYCAAISAPEECETQHSLSKAINTTAPFRAAHICARFGVKFIFTSTDLVFDGLNPPYSEHDPVCPVNHYGRMKAEAEERILSVAADALVCRLPLMYGYSFTATNNFTASVIRTLLQNRPVKLFDDEFRTPANVSAIASFLLCADHCRGILHLGGRERVSRYDFGIRIALLFGCDTSLVKPISQQQIKTKAARPQDVSLDSVRAFGVGYSPKLIKDELVEIKKEGHFE